MIARILVTAHAAGWLAWVVAMVYRGETLTPEVWAALPVGAAAIVKAMQALGISDPSSGYVGQRRAS